MRALNTIDGDTFFISDYIPAVIAFTLKYNLIAASRGHSLAISPFLSACRSVSLSHPAHPSQASSSYWYRDPTYINIHVNPYIHHIHTTTTWSTKLQHRQSKPHSPATTGHRSHHRRHNPHHNSHNRSNRNNRNNPSSSNIKTNTSNSSTSSNKTSSQNLS